MKLFEISTSEGHGKTVKGLKETSTVQVKDFRGLSEGFLLIGQFSYKVGDKESFKKALKKAGKLLATAASEEDFFNKNK